VASGQDKTTGAAKPAIADSSRSKYNFYFNVDVSDGVDMDLIWSGFSTCLREHQYQCFRGTFDWKMDDSREEEPGDAVTSSGTINRRGTGAIVGPFNSKQELEAALENVKSCLDLAAHKVSVRSFSNGVLYFKQKK
jgi:hypothetical protein